jgi:hypothetical protein
LFKAVVVCCNSHCLRNFKISEIDLVDYFVKIETSDSKTFRSRP